MNKTQNYICKKCGWALIAATFEPKKCYNCDKELSDLKEHNYQYFKTNIIKKLPRFIED